MPRSVWTLALVLLLPSAIQAGHSNSLLDVHPDGSKLLVVNADSGSATVVDLKTRKPLHEVKLGDKPEGGTWVGNTSLALVTVYRDDYVAFIDTKEGKVVHKLKVEDEPYGIVALKDGSKAYVTLEYPGKVIEIDVAARKVTREMPAGEMVRGIALSPDEKRIYVTEFYTGFLHAIDRESGKVVDTWKGHTTDNLARNIAVHPTRPKAYLSHIRSKVMVNHGDGSIFPQVTICDLVPPGKQSRRTSVGMDSYNGLFV